MVTVTVFDRYSSGETTSGERFLQEPWTEFDDRFSRCYSLLRFVARRILGSSEEIEDVIKNCRARASQSSPEFEQEGAFRSWLVRVLIDEALAVLRRNRAANVNADES
jgi:RNA polymerase sigma factor (sigma-70 family)